MRCTWGSLLFGLCVTSSTYGGLGCSDCSVSGQDPVVYEGGKTNVSKTIYQSSMPDAEMLHFPQGRIYQLPHGLGVMPVSVDVYLSFRNRLTEDGDTTDKRRPNNVALSSGNLSVIEVWNDEIIQIRNDTCENDLHVRVVAFADPDERLNLGGASPSDNGGAGPDSND